MIQDHFLENSNVVEEENLDKKKNNKKIIIKKKKNQINLDDLLKKYSKSQDFGKPYTYTEETYNQFLLTTIKNVTVNGKNVGYLTISENANEIRTAINERKSFVIRTALLVVVAINFFFSFKQIFFKTN